jgi:AraC-like DNA-binding protein
MVLERAERSSDSPFVKSITRSIYGAESADLVVPDGSWDLLIITHLGSSKVLLTGTTTRPVTSINDEGDELLCISFKPGIYNPYLPPRELRDRGLMLAQRNRRSFELGSQTFEIPNFENADDFVARISKAGLLAKDDLVEAALSGDPKAASIRSLQRHFIASTGLTFNFYQQLERAQRAAELLRRGRSAVDVALDTGFTDQSHMTNSLRALLGKTPSQIARASPDR